MDREKLKENISNEIYIFMEIDVIIADIKIQNLSIWHMDK
jgi:hypothetical protein